MHEISPKSVALPSAAADLAQQPFTQSLIQQRAGDAPGHARQVDIAPVTVPVFADGGVTRLTPVDLTLIPSLGGRALLDQFSLLPTSVLERYVNDHPEAVADLLATPIAATEVERWWGEASPAVRQKLISTTPDLVGNLDGIPFGTRNLANRQYLAAAISGLEEQLSSGVGRGMNVDITNHLHMLTQIDHALKAKAGDPVRTLVSLDTDAPGRAAIVVGDLASADYVSYLIPGMFFTIDGQVDDWADTATTLFHDQLGWLDRLGESAKTVATVAWIGYQTPHLLNVGSLTLADEGAGYLARTIEGLQALRGDHQPYVSVMAHSYGSTAAMIALQRGDFQIDALAVVGSPGSSAQTAAALSVRNANVYVGEAGWDPVVNSAFYGSDPGAASYGAYRMSVAGGVDAITNKLLGASYGHNEYFQPGSESMRNLALIGIGAGGLVMNDSGTTIAAAGR
ncbi:MAG TPA: alpha/beta hydrolase [Terrimesophilobacter sp.]|nr:alpha/beta hydrolase [Terrimesophilobacter sp.]